MTLQAVGSLLQAHDPLRFGMVMAAAPGDRPKLATLYALNFELARAPFQSAEPMLAQMRVQWWIDRLAEMGREIAPPLHDVLEPLWQVWGKDAGALVPLAEARIRDCDRQPFPDPDAVAQYVEATTGRLTAIAADALGAPPASASVIKSQALGCGIGAWLKALPQLREMGIGLARDLPEQRADLAKTAASALRSAAKGRREIPRRAAPALFAPAGLAEFLDAVADGKIDPTITIPQTAPFRERLAFARLALTGRWWV